jgi:hypothetical protein
MTWAIMNKKKERFAAGMSNFNLINRGYNARMRDVYFLKVQKTLNEFSERLRKHPLAPDIPLLNRLNSELSTTDDFARQAIAGIPLSSGQAMQSHGAAEGPAFFKEEILFINLLEELCSSGIFLLNRLNTIYELNSYKGKIHDLLKVRDKTEGYLSKILHFINENQKAEDAEIKQIIVLILERMALAHRIYKIIRTKRG